MRKDEVIGLFKKAGIRKFIEPIGNLFREGEVIGKIEFYVRRNRKYSWHGFALKNIIANTTSHRSFQH
jgi:hypothetical protein